jgi:hypothetical protein
MAGKRSGVASRSSKSIGTFILATDPAVESTDELTSAECNESQECSSPASEICEEDVRTRAYLKWEAAGRPDGDGLDFWVDAEREILGECNVAPKPHF